jgi:RecA-family ATPase
MITTTAEHRLVMNARKEPQWLIDGFVGRTPALLYADPKVGKTHLALNMVAALLDGASTFLDSQEVHGPAPCLYVALDAGGKDEITERLEGLSPKPAFVTSELDMAEIAKVVADHEVRFVVLDNVARILSEADDFNLPGAIAPLTTLVDQLTEMGAATLVIHHTSKPSKDTAQSGRTPSGTYALMAYFRQLIEMTPTRIIVKSNAKPRQDFAIKASAAGEHGVRYHRDYDAPAARAERRARRQKVKEPSTLVRRASVVDQAAAATRPEAIQAIMAAEPKADRETIRRYVGQHADRWGLA